jgi:hypothetical protein
VEPRAAPHNSSGPHGLFHFLTFLSLLWGHFKGLTHHKWGPCGIGAVSFTDRSIDILKAGFTRYLNHCSRVNYPAIGLIVWQGKASRYGSDLMSITALETARKHRETSHKSPATIIGV